MAVLIALLRGINVGGKKRLPMAELRALCAACGLEEARTYIQSGNLVARSREAPGAVEAELERAIERRFGFPVEVVARTAEQWRRLIAANPLAAPAREDPSHVLLALAKRRLRPGAAAELGERARAGERVEAAAGALWIHFPAGIARSKLTPAVLDRCAGSPVTARNWNTVLELERLARGGT